MENLKQINSWKKTLDLREWRKQIKQNDVERIVNEKDMWNYRWFSEDKKRISTLKGWKLNNYKSNEVEILFIEEIEKVSDVKQETKSETLTDLFLSPENKVKNTAEAYEKAKYSNKTPIFRFISKWTKKAIIVLDFSKWKKPKRSVYPLDKYRAKMKVIEI